jgi:hypothetical protein
VKFKIASGFEIARAAAVEQKRFVAAAEDVVEKFVAAG